MILYVVQIDNKSAAQQGHFSVLNFLIYVYLDGFKDHGKYNLQKVTIRCIFSFKSNGKESLIQNEFNFCLNTKIEIFI